MAFAPSSAVGDLADRLPECRVAGDRAARVTGLAYDSRDVVAGDLFAALVGGYADGHGFADKAAAAGASALLVERELPLSLPQLIVPDSRAALARVADALYRHPSGEIAVVGITGTDGKTTTSFLTDAVFGAAGRVTGMIGTVAVRIAGVEDRHALRQTTPESADVQRLLRAMIDAGAGWAILEATSHGLGMHRLDDVEFRVGAVTNITSEHLEFHGTVERYWRAKGTLFERVAAVGGAAVVNIDDPGARSVLAYCDGARLLTTSIEGGDADLQATDVVCDGRGCRFTLRWRGESAAVALPMLGRFNVQNATCAVGIALATGIPLAEVTAALANAPSVPGRMALVDAGQPFAVVVDYAHTPASLAKVLGLLRTLHPDGRLIALFGSAGERDVEKRAVQGRVAAELADIVIVTSEDPRFEDPDAIIADIARGATDAGARVGERLHLVTDRRDAIRLAAELAQPGDCLLLAGKGHEGSIIWGGSKQPWDEEQVAREVLAELGGRA